MGNGVAENREQRSGCRCFSPRYGSLYHYHYTGAFGHEYCQRKTTRTDLSQMQETSIIDMEQDCKMPRSEERRVGKECRARWGAQHLERRYEGRLRTRD